MIDSHAHLDLPEFDRDRDEVLARAWESGVKVIVNPAVDLDSSRRALKLARENPRVFGAVGFHPNDTEKMVKSDLAVLGELAVREKAVAVGEIGLDFYRQRAAHDRQVSAFRSLLDLARELGLPVIVHSREANAETEGIIAAWVQSLSPSAGHELGVMHCFSADIDLARRYIGMGFLISVAGPVTYPGAVERVEVARAVPLDKILVETDSPFLAPQACRGRRNEPACVAHVVQAIADARGLPPESVARATAENAVRLFRLPMEAGYV